MYKKQKNAVTIKTETVGYTLACLIDCVGKLTTTSIDSSVSYRYLFVVNIHLLIEPIYPI